MTVAAVSVGPEGETVNHIRRFQVSRSSVADIEVRNVEVKVSPFSFGGRHGKDDRAPIERTSTNERTMARYFDPESIASLTEESPGHYVTSVSRTLIFTAVVEPAEFAPLIEWRTEGRAYALGSLSARVLDNVGTHTILAGQPDDPQRIVVDTYDVTITSHISGKDIVGEDEVVAFTAVTDPPGYEDRIMWLSSTKYGIADPVTEQGQNFVVGFSDTWGPDPEEPDGILQWLGVKADNTVFNQDQKCRGIGASEQQAAGCIVGTWLAGGSATFSPTSQSSGHLLVSVASGTTVTGGKVRITGKYRSLSSCVTLENVKWQATDQTAGGSLGGGVISTGGNWIASFSCPTGHTVVLSVLADWPGGGGAVCITFVCP
jgi:hypothetical protein